MNKLTHIVFAFLLFSVFYNVSSINIGFAGIVAFATIFPDFDLQPHKWHRKLLHNFWVLLLIGVIVYRFLSPWYMGFFAFGFIAHILADSLNPTGVWVFWPVSEWRLKLGKLIPGGPISTGSTGEWVLLGIMLAIGAVLFL